MPDINIDELCEPIKVTVGGKTYTVDDISRNTAIKMEKLKDEADKAEETGDSYNYDPIIEVLSEILSADKAVIGQLGIRRLLLLSTRLMETINQELEGKNVQKAVPTK